MSGYAFVHWEENRSSCLWKDCLFFWYKTISVWMGICVFSKLWSRRHLKEMYLNDQCPLLTYFMLMNWPAHSSYLYHGELLPWYWYQESYSRFIPAKPNFAPCGDIELVLRSLLSEVLESVHKSKWRGRQAKDVLLRQWQI